MTVNLSWTSHESLRVLSIRPEPAADEFADGLARVLAELRALFCDDGTEARVALVITLPAAVDPLAAAATEALAEGVRGIAGALTRELRERARINVVVTASDDPLPAALDFLAGDG